LFTGNNTLDLREKGIDMFLRSYQRDIIEHLYATGETTSAKAWRHINRPDAPDPHSRASVILFLQTLAREELISGSEVSGKGGYRGIYRVDSRYPSPEALGRELVRRLLVKVSEDFKMAGWVPVAG